MIHKITDSFDKFLYELNEEIKRKEIVVFCGAGISLHSGLPMANELVRAILAKLSVLSEEAESIINSSLPFEAFIEILNENSDPTRIFDIFDIGEPNTNHFLLAKLAKTGYVTTICTTNFDLLIEKAFESEGLVREYDYRVFYKEDDIDHIDWDDNTIRLIKIHGSVEDKDNMAITLEQVASKILSSKRQSVIENIFSKGLHKSVLVMGYSCSDVFDISPQIEIIQKNHKKVIFIDHHKDKRTVKNMADKKQKNPFNSFDESKWVLYDTDELVKAVWEFCFLEVEYVSPKSNKKNSEWQQCIELWFLETEEKYTKGIKYGIAGHIFQIISEWKKAIDNYKHAVKTAREISNKEGEGTWRGNLGNSYFNLGDYQNAINNYKQALSIAREIGDRRHEGTWLGNLGSAYYDLGDYKKAIDNFKKALRIAREIGVKVNEGIVLGNLGSTYQYLSDYKKAIDNYEQALSIAREIGDRQYEGTWLGNLGCVYSDLGDYQKAIGNYEQALSIAREIGDKRNEGTWLGNLGSAYQWLCDYQKAVDNYEQAYSTLSPILGDNHPDMKLFDKKLNIAKFLQKHKILSPMIKVFKRCIINKCIRRLLTRVSTRI